mgnify:CR=1 FL=1
MLRIDIIMLKYNIIMHVDINGAYHHNYVDIHTIFNAC